MRDRNAIYLERKIDNRCPFCQAGLTDDAETVLCIECVERRTEADKRYRESDTGKAAIKAWEAAHVEQRKIGNRKHMGRLRADRKRRGVCVRCGNGRPPGPRNTQCQRCLDKLMDWRASRRAA